MAEYIEREALRDALYDADAITMQGVKILNQFPAADVVEVVRCMACERGRPTEYATDTVWRTCLRQDMELDDFCSYGNKREVKQNG